MTAKLRKEYRKRAAIEPIMGHVKLHHQMNRNFYMVMPGYNINITLAAVGVNFKMVMNKWKSALWL